MGGDSVEIGEFPHMAALGRPCNQLDGRGCVEKTEWFCGASLISERFVLTAAHCAHIGMSNPPTVVRLGSRDLLRPAQDCSIQAIQQHPGYVGIQSYNDIALVKLEQPVNIAGMLIRPACLWTSKDIPDQVPIVATGWGKLGYFEESSTVLQRVQIPIVSNEQCNKVLYRSRRFPYGVLPTQLCAGHPQGGKDTCEGDSGGPLQIVLSWGETGRHCQHYIVGITSNGGICGTVNRPGIYTRVSSYVSWIERMLQSQQY
ncbi:serine protease snake-like [Anopheles nili]|uniref:serine protease snake-like n=1 Tax=Anopheles nili TaxID=185578 RepID=UPI00237B69A5|nr:serine protease snake-like [Anopheles nili]